MRSLAALFVSTAMIGTGGCVVARPVVGAGAAVAGAAVKTTAKVTSSAAGAVADAVVPDGEDAGAADKTDR